MHASRERTLSFPASLARVAFTIRRRIDGETALSVRPPSSQRRASCSAPGPISSVTAPIKMKRRCA